MVKKDNTRIIITFSKAQANWLKTGAKKLNISVSKFVKWLIDKNISRILSNMNEKDYKEIIKIAKMPWITFQPGDEYEWDENRLKWSKK